MRIRPKNLALSVLIGGALAVIGWIYKPASSPGRLVADEQEIFWQSPAAEIGHAPVQVKARFRLVNMSGRVVNIISVESGCGCARAIPSETSIGPRRVAWLDVEGTPFPIGDRTVPISVLTDSPLTPKIDLRLRMVGSRTPPFLLNAEGDLSFINVERSRLKEGGESRKFVVRLVESDSAGRDPSFRFRPPSLRIEKISSTTEPYLSPGSVLRTQIYSASFVEFPVDSRIAGVVSVVDPWFQDHVIDLNLYAEIRSRIRIAPSRGHIDITGDTESSTNLLIFTREPAPISISEYKIDNEGPIRVEPIAADGGVATFKVIAKLPHGLDEATGKITVWIAPIANESAVTVIDVRRAKR